MPFEGIPLTALSYERTFAGRSIEGVIGMSTDQATDALLKVVTPLPARGFAAPRIPMIYSVRPVT